ncbi:MAG TPA: haloacid dehalogenase [Anaerolineae bacterium]|jgi:translin|nr:haloacid dehalogenase [Anaerolineae bacterium]
MLKGKELELGDIDRKVRESLDAKNRAREIALPLARQVIRSSSVAIRAIHREKYEEAQKHLGEAKSSLVKAQEALKAYPEVYFAGFLQDAEKEYSEGMTTFALVTGTPLPDPDSLVVGYPPFLSGLGEAMGELRRHILDIIRGGKLTEGERFLTIMDDVYYFLISFDYPDALTPGLRRITDLARSVMEKTRGDLTTAMRQHELNNALQRVEGKLDSNE